MCLKRWRTSSTVWVSLVCVNRTLKYAIIRRSKWSTSCKFKHVENFTTYSNNTNSMKHHCSCCRETALQRKEVEMSCIDGTKKTLTYSSVSNCTCIKSQCESNSWNQQKKHLQHVFQAQLLH
uniref:CTCK domain-containing protein n=1 Tax=Eptatretus burgeri TaxID=7764 RepID=A0A8C4R4T9_EPTBU